MNQTCSNHFSCLLMMLSIQSQWSWEASVPLSANEFKCWPTPSVQTPHGFCTHCRESAHGEQSAVKNQLGIVGSLLQIKMDVELSDAPRNSHQPPGCKDFVICHSHLCYDWNKYCTMVRKVSTLLSQNLPNHCSRHTSPNTEECHATSGSLGYLFVCHTQITWNCMQNHAWEG
jgi:hypothetical protein